MHKKITTGSVSERTKSSGFISDASELEIFSLRAKEDVYVSEVTSQGF